MSRNFFWIIPFICFVVGYFLMSQIMSVAQVQTPAVVGMPLQKALKALSAARLHATILAEKDDAAVPSGTVLDQNPRPSQIIKVSQPVYLIVTKKPDLLSVPSFIDLNQKEAETLAAEHGLKIRIHSIESMYPFGRCFAQSPKAGDELHDPVAHLYVSSGTTTHRIFPDCRTRSVASVTEFLKNYGMKPQVIHTTATAEDHTCDLCVVKEQRPLPGTIIDLKKHVLVQLLV